MHRIFEASASNFAAEGNEAALQALERAGWHFASMYSIFSTPQESVNFFVRSWQATRLIMKH